MDEIYETCFICNTEFQMGPHRYDGKWNRRYQMSVCTGCHKANWDGWNHTDENKILKHLEDNGLTVPERNENGLLPRG